MEESVLSVGIDIGTKTTQIIFSRLTVRTSGGFGAVPRAEVTDKQVVYRGAVRFTPLRSGDEIDAGAQRQSRQANINAFFRRIYLHPNDFLLILT